MPDHAKPHKQLLKEKGTFHIDCNTIIFSEDELAILKKYGHWFRALTNETLTAFTDRQKQFIEVAHGQRDPFAPEEVAWFKYLGRKKIEQAKGDRLYRKPRLADDPFYSRAGAKELRKRQFGDMRKIHRE